MERFSGSSGRIGWSSVLLTSGLAVGDTDSLTPAHKDKEAVEGYTIFPTSSTDPRRQLFQHALMAEMGCSQVRETNLP